MKSLSSVLVATAVLYSGAHAGNPDAGYQTLRRAMVREQLVPRGIVDLKVLKSMEEIERHLFVPFEVRELAYEDRPLAIGYDQTISQPYMVAVMTEALQLTGKERVLEIGTGSGYQAALLSRLAGETYTIEIVEPLGLRADSTLRALGYTGVRVRVGDGFDGWAEHAPFDRVLITCAVKNIPKPLIEQLAEGGKMVLPHGKTLRVQKLKRLTKRNGKLASEEILDCVFVPMTGKHDWE